MLALYVKLQLHMLETAARAAQVCLICMPDMWALCVCLICMAQEEKEELAQTVDALKLQLADKAAAAGFAEQAQVPFRPRVELQRLHTHTHTHIRRISYIYTHIHVYMYLCMHVHIRVCVCARARIHTYVCV